MKHKKRIPLFHSTFLRKSVREFIPERALSGFLPLFFLAMLGVLGLSLVITLTKLLTNVFFKMFL
jgi:hypothetical protein